MKVRINLVAFTSEDEVKEAIENAEHKSERSHPTLPEVIR